MYITTTKTSTFVLYKCGFSQESDRLFEKKKKKRIFKFTFNKTLWVIILDPHGRYISSNHRVGGQPVLVDFGVDITSRNVDDTNTLLLSFWYYQLVGRKKNKPSRCDLRKITQLTWHLIHRQDFGDDHSMNSSERRRSKEEVSSHMNPLEGFF